MASSSPDSRQLLEDFSRMLLERDREFRADLDKASEEQEKAHLAALAASAEEHEKIRRAAEIARERHDLQIQAERRRREQEESRALERERRAQAEAEQAEHNRKLQKLQEEEAAQRKAAEKARELAEAERRIKEEKEKKLAEEEKRQAEADKKAKEAADAAREAAAKPVPTIPKPAPTAVPQPSAPVAQQQTNQQQTSTSLATNAQREALHEEYLQIHQRLKDLRKQVAQIGKQNKAIGDIRRQLKSRVGQLTTDSAANVASRKKIIEILMGARSQGGQPEVDVRLYVSSKSPIASETSPCMMPVLLVYFLHMFCKFVCKQLCTEVGNESNMAEPIMIQVAFIFSEQAFYWKESSLIDILLAKFHKACPVLFGVYGDESTPAGRKRLGWAAIGGAFINESEHRRRIEGFALGFAGLSLRDFSKNKTRENPERNTEFWLAMSYIVNTPTANVTKTHLIVLRNLIEEYVERIIKIFGNHGIAALRLATSAFPQRVAARFPNEAKELSLLPDVFRRNLRFSL